MRHLTERQGARAVAALIDHFTFIKLDAEHGCPPEFTRCRWGDPREPSTISYEPWCDGEGVRIAEACEVITESLPDGWWAEPSCSYVIAIYHD